MSIYKRIYIFEKIIEKWESPEFTIKDRELLYSKFINEQYDFCEENINYLYKTLVPWLEKENNRTWEILIWYRSNSFPLFPFYLFSLLALCSVYKLATPSLVQKKNVICNLLQSIFAALDGEE